MPEEYSALTTFVRRIQRGLYARRILQAGVVLLTLSLLLLLLGVGVRLLVPLLPLLAPIYSGLALVIVLLCIGVILAPALRRISRRQALTSIEHTYPDLHDDLTNALELDPVRLQQSNPHGMALDLVHALHRQTAQKLRDYTPQAVMRRHHFQGLAGCGLLVLATLLVTVIQPVLLNNSVHMLLHPLSYLPSRDVHLAIYPEQVTIARGTNLEVRVDAGERAPRRIDLLVKRPEQQDKRYTMEPLEPGAFRYVFLKPQTSFSFQGLAGSSASPEGTATVVPAPAIGKMSLHYLFPDYTGLAARTQEGGGDIQALPGTQVRLSMQANVPLSKGRLHFADGSELPLSLQDQTLAGEILVMSEGSYSVEVEDTHGLKNAQPPWYTVQLTPDATPSVKLLHPENDQEIDETTVIDVRYEAEDDFGLQDASLVYIGADGVEHRVALHLGRFDGRRAAERFAWDMYQHPLPDGETVQVYVEVYDNDTISGPKKGVSETLTLKVRNRQQEHEDLEDLQKEIADTLLDLLADHLELADDLDTASEDSELSREQVQQVQQQQQQAMERAEQLSEQIDQAMTKVQNDPYSTYETFTDLQALQRNMDYLQQNLMPQLQQNMQAMSPPSASPSPEQREQTEESLEEVVEELERLSSLADNIATSEKFHDLMQLSTKMMEQQNQLLSAMDNLPKDFKGGEIPPELQKMLDALDDLMQELANALSQMPQMSPDEFLNQQLSNLPLSDMQQQLNEMQKKLAEGDLEGAKKLAEELLKTLSNMVASMQNMMQQSGSDSMNAMSQQLQESSDALTDLVQRQEAIVDDTQRLDHATLQRLNQAQKEAFEAMQSQLAQEISELSKRAGALSRQARQHPELNIRFQRAYRELLEQLRKLQKQVADHDIPQARDNLEAAERQLSWMQQQVEQLKSPDTTLQQHAARAQDHLQAARRRMDSLPQDRQAMLNPEQRGQLDGLGEQQQGVRDDTAQLHQAFNDLKPLMPFLPAETVNNLRDAVPFMQNAQDELSGHRSQQALPPEREALERLRTAQNSLQQALQQLAQRGQMMGQSMPMLRQAGRLPMPGMMQPQTGQQQSGAAGASVRNFQLPDKEAYKVPRMFREDIMDALKEGYPERYKELIEQYYRNIVR
ncbi:MAG: hypothetical protein OEU26_04895 [Candidatus Tectomicrobia bacterium]|nr:hypothetical protein [Candidatus Tectomicrobia bacterium]